MAFEPQPAEIPAGIVELRDARAGSSREVRVLPFRPVSAWFAGRSASPEHRRPKAGRPLLTGNEALSADTFPSRGPRPGGYPKSDGAPYT